MCPPWRNLLRWKVLLLEVGDFPGCGKQQSVGRECTVRSGLLAEGVALSTENVMLEPGLMSCLPVAQCV